MRTRHAVLTDTPEGTRVYRIMQGQRRLESVWIAKTYVHVSELWEDAQAWGNTHFWIMENSLPDNLGYLFFEPREGWDIFVPLANRGELRPTAPRGGRCWKAGGSGFQIFVFFPQREPWSWPVENPLETLATVDYLTRVLGIDVQWSPQAVGAALLNMKYQTTNRLKEYLLPPDIDLKALPFRKADKDMMFVDRGSMAPSMVGKILHLYDRSSDHPAGAAQVITGCGTPRHIQGPGIVPSLPGLYHITWRSNGSIFDGWRLPTIFERGQEWATAPTVQFALRRHYEVNISEAYVFDLRHQMFKGWVHDLWQARCTLESTELFPYEAGREIARDTVKHIMNSTLGSMRENWRADMVGQAKVQKLAHLALFVEQPTVPCYPLVIFHDAMGFVSEEPNPYKAVPGIINRTGQLGGYKVVYSLPITQELYDNLCEARNADTMIKVLHRTARTVGVR